MLSRDTRTRPFLEREASAMSEILEQVRGWITLRVAEGFESDADILAASVEIFGDAFDAKKLRPFAAACTAEVASEHRRDQSDWPETTDCDRLDAAFADLETAGICARQHFSCCYSCATDEMQAEIDETAHSGYAYTTPADTEQAATHGRMFVSFGSTAGGRRANAAIGQRVLAALRRAGLRAEWDGDPDHRIALVGLVWKRRR